MPAKARQQFGNGDCDETEGNLPHVPRFRSRSPCILLRTLRYLLLATGDLSPRFNLSRKAAILASRLALSSLACSSFWQTM